MTPEQAKSINGTEIQFKPFGCKRSFSCLILASPKLGTSFKFIPQDGYEKRSLIQVRAKICGISYAESKARVESPDYCFAMAEENAPFSVIKKFIKIVTQGEDTDEIANQKSDTRCPFYGGEK